MLTNLLKVIFSLLLTLSIKINFAQPQIALQTVGSGFSSPVDVVNAGDSRLFVVEQAGYIRILHPEDGSTSLFMNIDARVSSGGGEQGLLGLAFDPNYSSNGYFYVDYINNAGNTRISRFSRDAVNPDLGNSASETILLTITQPYTNHNGGDLLFGPDGYLYIGMGDGGSGGDPGNRAQDITSQLLGKMLRIDVSAGGASYTIPPTNPYVGISGDDEIWAYGLRNPWRFSFDRLTGDMWIGDVGQDLYEEVDFQPASSTGGINYGWRCYEANHTYNTSLCDLGASYTFPVLEYPHSAAGGYAITGGFVYRGSQYPSLYGYYIVADFESGNFWTIKNTAGVFTSHLQGVVTSGISAFGEGNTGELYACNLYSGEIEKVIALCGAATGITTTDITATTATITWNSSGAASYKVIYKPIVGGAPITINTASTSVNLTALLPNTSYSVKIKNKCPGVAGMYTTSSTFATLPGKEVMDPTISAMPMIIPNYSSGLFTITNITTPVYITVFDIAGRKMKSITVTDNTAQLNISEFDAGIYFVQFSNDSIVVNTQKIIVVK